MQSQPLENNNKQLISLPYKIITLTSIMGNWLLCFSLMFLNFDLYKQITLCALIYLLYWSVIYNGKLIYGVCKTLKIIDNEKKRYSSKLEKMQQLNKSHTFIVPNYKQSIDVLRRTLQALADHQFSESYLVVLAMQSGENEAAIKAVELIREFKNSFKGLEYTLHTATPGEAQGKSANVNWCAKRLQAIFEKYQIDANQVLITVIDADSIIPQIYIAQLERKCLSECSNIHNFMFCSPHTYCLNRKESMILGRAFDTLYSFLHFVTMHSFFNVSFPISNYTISFNTLKEINFNDVHQDCIAQDCHLTLKAISETKGRLSVVPIYTFSNQMNLVGGKSFVEEFKSKFWQEQRHQRGVLQIAYAFKNVVNTNFRNKRVIMAFLTVFQVYFDQVAGLWYSSFLIYQFIYQFLMGTFIDPSGITQIIQLLSFILTLEMLTGILMAVYARFSFQIFFFKIMSIKDRIIQIAEFLILFPVTSIIYAQTAGIVAVVQLFNENSKYVTTEKKISTQ